MPLLEGLSGAVGLYITIALAFLLAVLVAILLIKRRSTSSKSHLVKLLKEKGIVVIDKGRGENSGNNSSDNSEFQVDEELNAIFKRLNELADRESLFKERHEAILSREVDKLYSRIKPAESAEAENINAGAAESEKPVGEKQKLSGEKPLNASGIMDEDVKKVLRITDELLEKLPDDVLKEFVESEEFEIYKRVVEEAKN